MGSVMEMAVNNMMGFVDKLNRRKEKRTQRSRQGMEKLPVAKIIP
jgi:hypothetical protein